LPAVIWAIVLPLWNNRRLAVYCVLSAAAAFATTFGLWMALVVSHGLLRDYRYLFFINKYDKPPEFYWPLVSLWWSFHGGLWVDRILIPLAGIIALGAALAWRSAMARRLLLDPVFGASAWAVAGYILFMTYQNHPQPRYFAVVAFFSFFMLAQGIEELLGKGTLASRTPARIAGFAVVALTLVAVGLNVTQTATFAAHPEYTLVNAVNQLTQYIDAHPNGNRMVVSISGDEITLLSQLQAMCDDFGTQHLDARLSAYQPGWYATWNDIDPGILESIHESYSMEQVATFPALDDPQRNSLVLFKLHALPGGKYRDPSVEDLTEILPDDKIDIPLE